MENFFDMITKFVKAVADFLTKLFNWKKDDFEPASDAISEYLSEKEAEKA